MTGTYLYAVARPAAALATAQITGLGGAPVRFLDGDGTCCAVSAVDLAEFGDEPLRRNLEDLAWLERVAREHDDVVRAVAELTPTIPLRLGTVYTDDASALRHVDQLRGCALATLDVLADRQEWGVKVYGVPRRPEPAAAGARASSGLDYLRQRRADLDRRTVETEASVKDADEVFERLRAVSVLARRHRPQDPALSGVKHPMLLNAAFLVDRARVPELRAEVAALAADRPEGAVVLTGPWPSYSFATMDDA